MKEKLFISPAPEKNEQEILRPPRSEFIQRHDHLILKHGHGESHAHHGELFQGQIEDRSGRKRRCLVSLPCYSLFSRVTLVPDLSGVFRVEPSHKSKVKRVIEVTLAYLNAAWVGGSITVASNIIEGKGYGSSTADCVAAAIAAADAIGRHLMDNEIARLVVNAEMASDNVMFRQAVLFAQREGIVLESYGRPFPRVEVLGFDTDKNGFIDTLGYPPADYSWQHIHIFHPLIGAIRRAFRTGDLALLGRVATASAVINEEFLPKAKFAEIKSLAAHVRILGIAAAHSGTVLSLLLDPADPKIEYKVEFLQRELDRLGIRPILRFQTSPHLPRMRLQHEKS
jgi:uncharacterized protein involved in propanediol utilization